MGAPYRLRDYGCSGVSQGMSGEFPPPMDRPLRAFRCARLVFRLVRDRATPPLSSRSTRSRAIYLCFLLLTALYLAPGFAISRSWLESRFRGIRGAAISTILFLLPYLDLLRRHRRFPLDGFRKACRAGLAAAGVVRCGSRGRIHGAELARRVCLDLVVPSGSVPSDFRDLERPGESRFHGSIVFGRSGRVVVPDPTRN